MSYTEYTTKEERSIVAALLKKASAKGFAVSVYDGGEWVARKVSPLAARKYLATTGEDTLRFYDGERRVGSILLIWGNGEDVISDCSDNAEITELCLN